MQKDWNKPFKKIERAGPFTINNRWIGVCDEKTKGIVVDNIITREGERQVKSFRTSNIDLHKGLSTVAVFTITRRNGTKEVRLIEADVNDGDGE